MMETILVLYEMNCLLIKNNLATYVLCICVYKLIIISIRITKLIATQQNIERGI